jgi:hypothetical protein
MNVSLGLPIRIQACRRPFLTALRRLDRYRVSVTKKIFQLKLTNELFSTDFSNSILIVYSPVVRYFMVSL